MRNKMKIVLAMIIAIFVAAPMQAKKKTVEKTDRQVWADLCYKISQPREYEQGKLSEGFSVRT